MKIIKQTILFRASPHDLYEALMDSKKHSAFTGSKSKISRKAGGLFFAYDRGLHGKNLELKISFNRVKHGTKLYFIQTDVPDKCAKSIAQGWHDFYWTPIKRMIEA
ncbi:MAG: hypothetical protein HY051_01280 [Candidatus Aenigmarchaeota archaeon]|nr:hypothetical protein [Candidatus Aenigmarchaeota archaeon]